MPLPELTKVPSLPTAARSLAPPPGTRVAWLLRATFPAPDGTVYLRGLTDSDSETLVDVISARGALLHRARPGQSLPTLPRKLVAGYLDPKTRRGPCLRLEGSEWHSLWAFPDGFSGVFLYNYFPSESAPKLVWSGVGFVDRKGAREPGAADASEPTAFRGGVRDAPKTDHIRFAAAFFDTRYCLRWVSAGKSTLLEILDTRGARLARHELADAFSARTGFVSVSAMWLDEKRRRGPILVARDSDTVQVLVFTERLRRLVCQQDFNDGSSSLAATTVSFDHDKNGILTVSESYSERPEEGESSSPNDHETLYVWNGTGFAEQKPAR